MRVRKLFVSLLVVVVVIISVISVLRNISWRAALKRVDRIGYENILAAADEVISNYEQHCNLQGKSAAQRDRIGFNRDNIATLPADIQRLKPFYIFLHEDRLMVRIHMRPRLMVVAFADEAGVFGTVQLLPRLWLWNGVDTARGVGGGGTSRESLNE